MRRLRTWLADVPLADPVDRRNAPTLQVLLLILGVTPPAMWFYRAVFVPLPWRQGELVALGTSLVISALALASVWLIRRGHLQWAVRQLLVVIAVGIMLAAVQQGFTAGRFEHPLHATWLVMAGLLVGRRALWLMLGWIVASLFVGGFVDQARDAALMDWADVIVSSFIFLMITLLVDRTTAALRESLHVATQRAHVLEAARERLREEIAAREQTREQLIRVQKKDAVARLSLGISHDFSHLLAMIVGYAEQGRSASRDRVTLAALDNVMIVAHRATALARKLLRFSHHEEVEASAFDVRAAIEAMRPLLRQALAPGVELEIELDDRPCIVLLERSTFELIVFNFADNANRAMTPPGRFAIRVHAEETRVRVRFEDDGAGMDAATQARIFEPFFSTRAAHEGSGIGLALASDVVHAAGGTIEVRSAPAQGACFTVTLPRVDRAEAPAA